MKPHPEPSPILTVVVPVYNEADNLPAFLDELIPYCRARNWNLVLVDDGSKDASYSLLEAHAVQPGVTLLSHKVNRGYGGALKTGLLAVVTPYAVTIDADGQHSLGDIDSILAFALEKDADLVVGSRGKGGSGLYRNIGKWLIRRFASLLMPIPISDLNSGFKLYSVPLVKRFIPVCPDGMAFSDVITLVFLKKRYRVLEHSITIQRRKAGKSTINTFTAFQTIMEIINITMLFNPLRIFLPLSILCISFGLGWGIPIMLQDRGVSVGAMLGIVTGLLFFFIGLLAEQLSALRMGLLDMEKDKKE